MMKLIIEADLSSEELQVLIQEVTILHRDIFKKPLVLQQCSVSGAKRKLVCPKCGTGEENHKRMGEHVYCCNCDYEWNWG